MKTSVQVTTRARLNSIFFVSSIFSTFDDLRVRMVRCNAVSMLPPAPADPPGWGSLILQTVLNNLQENDSPENDNPYDEKIDRRQFSRHVIHCPGSSLF